MLDDALADPLAGLAEAVAAPDLGALAAAADAAAEVGWSGRLADFAQWLAGVGGSWPTPELSRVHLVIFSDTATGTGPPFARTDIGGVQARVVDCSQLGADAEAGADGVAAAVGRGAAVADEQIDSGTDLLVAVVSGSGPLLAARAAIAVLTDAEPAKVMDRGREATDPETWMADTLAVRDLRRAAFPVRHQSGPLLTTLGSTQLAAATGFVLQAAARRTGVVLDGLAAAAAALIARDAAPQAVTWWLAADTTPGPAYELAITRLGLRPILDLGIARADGTAGALAVPVLRAAGTLGH